MNVNDELWQQLLALREQSKSYSGNACGVLIGKQGIRFVGTQQELVARCNDAVDSIDAVVSLSPSPSQHLSDFTTYPILDKGLHVHCRRSLNEVTHHIFKLYLPLCTVALHSPNKTFVMVHAAQSLDGKVCTNNGASKWIGNDENLIHAHRIRALVDGVLVGGNTVRSEDPSLTVRHVSGPNPVRLFLCSQLNANNEMTLCHCGPTLLICSARHELALRERFKQNPNIRTLSYQTDSTGVNLPQLFSALFEMGIRSLMVEGGPTTISSLMQGNMVDWLQLHIAPMVFGSGRSLVALEEITSVGQANQLTAPFFTPMGDAMMVTGQL